MDVGHVCDLIIWEYKGRHRDAEQNPSTVKSYQESQGVDVEVGFGFAYDDMTIPVKQTAVESFKTPKGGRWSIGTANSRGTRRCKLPCSQRLLSRWFLRDFSNRQYCGMGNDFWVACECRYTFTIYIYAQLSK
jgi:hypothetical protein